MLREDMRSLVGHKGLYYHSRQRELYGYMLPLPTKSHAGTSHTVYSWHSWEKASLENPSILKGLPGTLPPHFPHMGILSLLSSVQSLSRVWLFGTPKDCSKPGFPVHHKLPELTQTHVQWVSDAIQSSHPLLSPSPMLNLSQHWGLFQWLSYSHQVAKVLEFQLQHQSFQWILRTDFL